MLGQWFDQFVRRFHFGEVVERRNFGRQFEHHLHHVMRDAEFQRHQADEDVIGHLHIVAGVAQAPLMRVVDFARLADARPVTNHVIMFAERIVNRNRAAPIHPIVKENRHGGETRVEMFLPQFRQFEEFVRAAVDARHRIVAAPRRGFESPQVLNRANRRAALPGEVFAGVFFAANKFREQFLGCLIGRERNDFECAGVREFFDAVNRRLDGFRGDADVCANDRTILALAHLANSLDQIIRPLEFFARNVDGLLLGKAFQLFHRDVIVGNDFEKVMEFGLVHVFLAHFFQVIMTFFGRSERIGFKRYARHRPHQVRGRAQSAEAETNPRILGMQTILGCGLDKFGDEFVHVQIAEPHRDADDFGARFANLVDHFGNRHGGTKLDGDITHILVLHPIGKSFDAEIVNALAYRADHHAAFFALGI